jgi:hypothetical protein
MQQNQTLFSVNHFTNNQGLFPQEQQYNFGYYPLVQTAPNQVWAPVRKLPADFHPNQSKPSVHRVSRPPKALIQPAPLAFPETTTSERVETVPAPCFKIQLSDPAFLLETEVDHVEAEVITPPKFDRNLSDPSFLLQKDPVVFEEPVILEEPVIFEERQILDEWQPEDDENELFVQDRSKSSESGSSYRSFVSKQQEAVLEPKVEKTQPTKVVVKSTPKWAQIHTVKRRRKKQKIIEVDEVYRAKRHVKVTKEEDPHFYGKPKSSRNKRRERDPNEIWTLNPGTAVEVLQIEGRRALIFCTVEFWSKHQDRNYDQPRKKRVEGWISLKDQKGWVL